MHAGREFVRTDRLLIRIRTYGTSAAAAEITGRLIDRRGATLIPLAIAGPFDSPQLAQGRPAEGWHRLDLPLASIAPGDFAIVFEARSGEERAEAIVPLVSKGESRFAGSRLAGSQEPRFTAPDPWAATRICLYEPANREPANRD